MATSAPPPGTSTPQHRVAEFQRWLNTRPEKFIILVGHCSFWHHFMGKQRKRMANGELVTMHW